MVERPGDQVRGVAGYPPAHQLPIMHGLAWSIAGCAIYSLLCYMCRSSLEPGAKPSEDHMEIDLSRDEYKSLIEMMYIADWVMNAYKTEKDPSTEQYAQLEQKIYSLADQMGHHHLIEYDEELAEYFPTTLLDEGPAMQYIDEYDNDTFWDELTERLVERDLFRQVGEERLRRMTVEERLGAEDPLRDKYGPEFEEHGIENVELRGSG
jgi:hypothetical protein